MNSWSREARWSFTSDLTLIRVTPSLNRQSSEFVRLLRITSVVKTILCSDELWNWICICWSFVTLGLSNVHARSSSMLEALWYLVKMSLLCSNKKNNKNKTINLYSRVVRKNGQAINKDYLCSRLAQPYPLNACVCEEPQVEQSSRWQDI